MADKLDDLDAVRRVVETLSSFEKVDQTRILRWACEKLGLPNSPAHERSNMAESPIKPTTEMSTELRWVDDQPD